MSRSLTVTVSPAAARGLAVVIGGGIILLALINASGGPRNTLAAESTAPEHTITVAGVGRVVLRPDIADVRLGVVVQKPTATEARSAAATAMTGVVEAIRRAGIAEQDIQTVALTLRPVYDYNKQTTPAPLVGFEVVNTVNVVVRDLSKVGDLIDDAVAAGASTVDGVTFRVNKPTDAEATARQAAVADARAKANVLATAAGVSIVGVSMITESSGPIAYPVYERSMVAAEAPTPVMPGQTEISVTVTIVYRIG